MEHIAKCQGSRQCIIGWISFAAKYNMLPVTDNFVRSLQISDSKEEELDEKIFGDRGIKVRQQLDHAHI